MPIEFRCANCHRLVSAPDSSAGHTGTCPHCAAFNAIPAAGKDGAGGAVASPRGAPAAETPLWPPSTSIASAPPSVPTVPSGPAHAPVYAQQSPYSDPPPQSPLQPDAMWSPHNGYQPLAGSYGGYGGYLRRHRGALVVTFGTISLAFGVMTGCGCLCCLLYPLSIVSVVPALGCGIPAVVLGVIDLRAMDDGLMDRGGRSQTKTGLVLGISGLAVTLLGMLLPAVMMFANVLLHSHRP